MEKLSTKKRLNIAGQYLSGLSYDEIAAKSGVSKGTVANVVAELKAGRFPEATDTAEHIEQLRELSLDLKRLKLTPGQCATGLILITRINECGLDPADIDRWPLILKSVGNQDEAQEFVRLVYSIQEVQQRMGLSLDALDNKVHELERKAADLKPMSGKLEDCKKQFTELTKRRGELASAVAGLEEKYKWLTPRVKDLGKREQDLSHRITEMEPRAHKAEMTFTTLSKEIQRLQDIGLAFDELAEFNERVQVIAQRHTIKPAELSDRLLHELESLDKGLGLEALIQSRQLELDKKEQAVANTKKELETTKAVVNSLRQEKMSLEASIKETREQVSREIAKIIPVARDTIKKLQEDLHCELTEASAEVHRIKNEAVEIGKEIGQYQGILECNEWLNELLALIRGEEAVADKRVRTIASSVLRGLAAWLKQHKSDSFISSSLLLNTENLIRELEQWKT